MTKETNFDNEAFKWLNENKLSYDIWNNKYRYNNESFNDWLIRVSGNNDDIKNLIKEKKFLFGGRILANRGLNKFGKKVTYSNCYVLPAPDDNLESIFNCASQLARTFSYGGGCGVDVSNLRPKNAKVNNAASSTSGVTSFMDFYSYVTGLIGQEGRRGATLLSINCTHPDLEEFINLKSDLNVCTKANISVRVTDEFMQAVINNEKWTLHFDTEHEHIEKTVNARDIFMLLAKRNWEMAEPGVLFWDNITKYNMVSEDLEFSYAGVNPCSEEPLPAGGSCLLGSLNLSEFVKNPFTDNAKVDYEALSAAVWFAVNALNQVLIEGLDLHPLEIQRNSVRDWRQIGLGTMGLADMLIKLGITYGSDESIAIIREVFRSIAYDAITASLFKAKVEGCYPKCYSPALVNSPFILNIIKNNTVLNDIKKHGLYNSQLLTCAPTGSTATMLEVSTGLEPNFAFSFNRRTLSLNKEETVYKVDAKIVRDYKEITGNTELPGYFVSSQDINPISRIAVQAELQKYIDASISSTINLPESTTIEDVFNIYIEAWKMGLKGITIWRDNCQRQGILTTDNKEVSKELSINTENAKIQIENPHSLKRGEIIKSGDNWIGIKRTLMTGCGSLHVQTFWDPNTGELREIYLSKGSTGGCNNFMISLSRMISLAARGGVGVDAILDQLKSCGVCPSYAVRSATAKDTSKGSSCPVAIGNALKDMSKEISDIICNCQNKEVEIKTSEPDNKEPIYEECPSCHEKTLVHLGGCIGCTSCGYSKCN
jgi:ribonucleoside-diphosphate reductase alpha chain